MASKLPEGTDAIIEDAAVDEAAAMDAAGFPDAGMAYGDASGMVPPPITPVPGTTAAPDETTGPAPGIREQAGAKAADLKDQATDKLRAYAETGKGKASETLQGFASQVDDVADQIEAKIGPQYGQYARSAAQTLTGLASRIDEQDVDALFAQGRDLVRKSPALAIGAAATIGFLVARLAKAGIDAGTATVAGAGGRERDVDFTPDPDLEADINRRV